MIAPDVSECAVVSSWLLLIYLMPFLFALFCCFLTPSRWFLAPQHRNQGLPSLLQSPSCHDDTALVRHVYHSLPLSFPPTWFPHGRVRRVDFDLRMLHFLVPWVPGFTARRRTHGLRHVDVSKMLVFRRFAVPVAFFEMIRFGCLGVGAQSDVALFPFAPQKSHDPSSAVRYETYAFVS